MKKIFLLFFILFLLPIFSAAQLTIDSQFDQDETLIAKISGNFIEPLQESNILLYQEHLRIPLNIELIKIQNNYYAYAQLLGKEQGDYSLKIENAKYQIINEILEEDIVVNFSITNQTADFSIEPGFVVTETGFSLELQNLNAEEVTIRVKEEATVEQETHVQGFFDALFGVEQETTFNQEREITLSSWESSIIDFNITNITETELREITLYTNNTEYNVPIYVILSEEINENAGLRSYVFSPQSVNFVMATNSETTRIVYLYNDGEETLEDITFYVSDSISPYVDLSVDYINDLEKNESVKLTLSFNSDDEEKTIEGDIRANVSGLYAYLGVLTDFVPDYIPLDEDGEEIVDPATNPAILETCEELEGIVCESNQACSEETEQARDGNCCPSEASCEDVEEEDGKGKIIGWTIIAALAIGVFWFYKKKVKK